MALSLGIDLRLRPRRGAAATGFSPLDLSPVWGILPDAGTFQTSGGAAATANNDPVGEWQDASGHGIHIGALTTARPLLKTAVVGSLPMVKGDGSNDTLTVTNAALKFTGPFTVFTVVKGGSIGDGCALLADWSSNAGWICWLFSGQARFGDDAHSTCTWVGGDTAINDGNVHLLMYRRDATNMEIWMDGTMHGQAANGTLSQDGAFSLFAYAAGAAGFSNHHQGDAWAFNSAITGTDQTNMETYLRTTRGWGFA